MLTTLSYSNILAVEPVLLPIDIRVDGILAQSAVHVVLARARELHAEVQFLYKGRVVKTASSWCELQAAIESATALTENMDIHPGSEAEIAVRAVVTETCVLLARPSLAVNDSTPTVDRTRPHVRAAIDANPDYRDRIVFDDIAWSSRHGADDNEERANGARHAVAPAACRRPHECMNDVASAFRQLQQLEDLRAA